MKYFDDIHRIVKPIFVDWAITTKCYLNCTHCRYNIKPKTKNQKPKAELNTKQALALAQEINKLKPQWIVIEGGEPFLRKDLFVILNSLTGFTGLKEKGELKLSNHVNPVVKNLVYIISSGMGFNESLAVKCKETRIKLMISLDSAIEETYKKIRIGAKLSDAVNAVKIAQKFGILDSINFTLQELNASVREIKAIGKMASDLDIKSINFFGLKPNSACATNSLLVSNFDRLFSEISNISEKYKINVKVDEPFHKPWLETLPGVFARNRVTKQSQKLEIATPPESRLAMTGTAKNRGPIVAEEKSGCIFGEYIFIEPDGILKPCSFSPLSYDEIGFDIIKKIQDKRNRKGKCGKCEYHLVCGGCRVRTYVLTGDWFESDQFCPL